MIDTKDLRLGNYVIYKHHLYIIDEITATTVYLNSVENEDEPIFWVLSEEIEPVPLDNDWLERLPIVKRPDKTDTYGGLLLRINENWIRIKDNKWNSGLGIVYLTYVHQLQNLYKVLTNTELY